MKKLFLNLGLSSTSLVKNVSCSVLVAMLALSPISVLSADKSAGYKAAAAAKKKKYRTVEKKRAIEGSHIVVLKAEHVQTEADLIFVELEGKFEGKKRLRKANRKAIKRIARELSRANGFEVNHVFARTIKGFSTSLDEKQIEALMLDGRVEYVQQDEKLELFETRTSPDWALDAIDNKFAEENGRYDFDYTGAGVTVYILDQGVTNQSGAFDQALLEEGTNIVPWGTSEGEDAYCESHGTKVAGIVASKKYGVAPGVTLVPVRVATCDDVSAAGNLRGLEWIIEDAETRDGPTVINMSLGGKSTVYAAAIQAAIDAGTTFVTSAGNSDEDACDWYPAKIPDAITVGASESDFRRAEYSNWGSCIDLFAPAGVLTVNRWEQDTFQGTSASSPFVAGVAALYLEANPSATPAEVSKALTQYATPGVITDPKGSPNLFLSTDFANNNLDRFPGKVQAEDYASENGIEIENTNDNGADLSVAYVNNNDSVTYDISVAKNSFYKIDFRVATPYVDNVINLSSDGNDVGSVAVPATGGWNNWQTVSTEVYLLKGDQKITLTFNGSTRYLFNLNWFQANVVSDLENLRLPGKIEAESYISESGIRLEEVPLTSFDYNLAYIHDGDSSTYLADVVESGKYTFNVRVASPYSGNVINVFSEGKLIRSITVDSTGGWRRWATVTTELDLKAGMQELTLEYKGDTGYLFNVNRFEAIPVR